MFKASNRWVFLGFAVGAIFAQRAAGQQAHVSVSDSATGRPLSDATVTLYDEANSALASRTTSENGLVLLPVTRGGLAQLIAKRVGYAPVRMNVRLDTDVAEFFVIAMSRVSPQVLDTVSVVAAPVPMWLEPFAERKKTGQGFYLTRKDLEKQSSRQLSEVLFSFPGVRIVRMSAGDAAIAGSRGSQSIHMRYGLKGGDSFDRRRGAISACYAQVFLDGVRVFAPQPDRPLFNVNLLATGTIEAIEFYRSPAETPTQYSTIESDCGTLLIWTRKGDVSK